MPCQRGANRRLILSLFGYASQTSCFLWGAGGVHSSFFTNGDVIENLIFCAVGTLGDWSRFGGALSGVAL